MKKKGYKRKPHRVRRKKSIKSILKNRFFWFFILFLVIISCLFYFLVFFEIFQIAEIKISGSEKVENQEIRNIVLNKINRKILFLNSKSIFLVDSSKINKEILNKYPVIDEVKIKKKFPNTLILEIKEREPFVVFCQGESDEEKCFFLDEKGIIFEEKENISKQELIIRFLEEENDISLGQELVEKEILNLISKIKKNMRENFQIDVNEAVICSSERLNIKTAENWQIYFNLESDIDLQITKLNLLLKEEIPPENRKNLEYIDLRFSRVFYR